MEHPHPLEAFLELSTALTGFEIAQLIGTGQAPLYLATARERAGDAVVMRLLVTSALALAEGDQATCDRALRGAVLSDACLGPLARNLIKLWYVGCWREMPTDWREAYGGGRFDSDLIPSPASYTEGLLWPAVGANPPGAKPHGYAMWATPPRVTLG